MTAISTQITPQDLLEMEDGHRYELINGELVERNMGAMSSHIASNVNQIVSTHVRENGLGLVFTTDCGYQIYADDPDKVRFPDGSFIKSGRLPNDEPPGGHVRIAPDWALEVISPNDLAWKVQVKVQEYLEAGVKLVWVVYPDSKEVLVYQSRADFKRLSVKDEIRMNDIMPEFHCQVADFFSQPASD